MAPDRDPPSSGDQTPEGRVTRRRFVASGVVLGAAVVWNAPVPFVDELIGASIASAAGPTGPTGSTGPTGPPPPTTPTTPTTPTAPTPTPVIEPISAPAPNAPNAPGQPPPPGHHFPSDRDVIAGLRALKSLKRTGSQVSFSQRFLESGTVAWSLDVRSWGHAKKKAHHTALPTHVGSAHKKLELTTTTRVKAAVKISKSARAALKNHPHAKIVLRTTFTDSRGHSITTHTLL
jgi:hypothetical protein